MASVNALVPPANPRKRGPKTAAGKARSSRNALKHGLRARRLIADEDIADFAAFGAAVRAELAPVGAFQADLVAWIVSASWRRDAPAASRRRCWGGISPTSGPAMPVTRRRRSAMG